MLLICVAAAWLFLRPSRPGPGDPASVVLQVRQLNQLATIRYTVQRAVTLEESRPPLSSERLLLIVQARIEAGIDLSSLQPRDVERRADGTLVIRLPAATILNVSIDEKETRVWDRQKTWWTPWVPYDNNMEQRARIQGLDEARKAAVDSGILKQAEAAAESSVRALLGLAGVHQLVIIPASQS
jgi:hypothetical protein